MIRKITIGERHWRPVLITFILGLYVLELVLPTPERSNTTNILVLSAGYALLMVLAGASISIHKDWLNPLTVLLAIAIIRFAIPLIAVPTFAAQGAFPAVFQSLNWGLWAAAGELALYGLLSVGFGWCYTNSHLSLPASACPSTKTSVRYVAITAVAIGISCLIIFVESNASFLTVAVSGAFRGTEITRGSGSFFYASLVAIPASVVLFYANLKKFGRPTLQAWLAIALVLAAFAVLGGRVRTLTPLICALLLIWYVQLERKISLRRVATLVTIVLVISIYMYVGAIYRSADGLDALLSFEDEDQNYPAAALFLDVGQLHALYAAVATGEGVLGGLTFTKLLWPLSDWFELPGRSTGIFLAEELFGFTDRTWGLHASLIGDAYSNFGRTAVFICAFGFGLILKSMYLGNRLGTFPPAFFVLGYVYFVRIFFESIEKYAELFTVAAFAIMIVGVASLINYSSAGIADREERPVA